MLFSFVSHTVQNKRVHRKTTEHIQWPTNTYLVDIAKTNICAVVHRAIVGEGDECAVAVSVPISSARTQRFLGSFLVVDK